MEIIGPFPGQMELALDNRPHLRSYGIAGEIMAVVLESGNPESFRTLHDRLKLYEEHITQYIDNKVTKGHEGRGLPRYDFFYASGVEKNSIAFNPVTIHFDDGTLLVALEGSIPEVGRCPISAEARPGPAP